MNKKEHLELLPHGEEFRFIHELLELENGKSAVGKYVISGKEEFLKGHFPDIPIWPGVIMIEAVAQLGGIVSQSDDQQAKLKNMRLTAVKNAKIIGTAEPGAELTIDAQLEGRMGTLIQISGTVSHGDSILCKVVVMLSGDL